MACYEKRLTVVGGPGSLYASGEAQVASWAAAVADGSRYSVAYEVRLGESAYPGISRGAHYQMGNEALLSAMEGDAAFARIMQDCVTVRRTTSG